MNIEILDDSLDLTNEDHLTKQEKDVGLYIVSGNKAGRDGRSPKSEEMKDHKQETLIDRSVLSTDYESDNVSLNVEGKRDILLEMKGENLFGRDVKVSQPTCIGNVYAFWYVRNQPMIVIGPHCKYWTFIDRPFGTLFIHKY
jgi:hypothetical protein